MMANAQAPAVRHAGVQTSALVEPSQSVDIRREVQSRLELPAALEMLSADAKVTPQFRNVITNLHADLLAAIPPAEPGAKRGRGGVSGDCWENSKGGVPSSSAGLEKWIDNLPARLAHVTPESRALATEVFTLAAEIRANGNVFAGRELFPHQFGLFVWFGMALLSSGYNVNGNTNRTFFINSPHGSGKTQVLGMIHLAALRAGVREDSEKITGYVTSRAFSGAQQVVGLSRLSRMVTHTFPEKFTVTDLKEVLRYAGQSHPDYAMLFKLEDWEPLLARHPNGFTEERAAGRAISKHIQSIVDTLGTAPANFSTRIKPAVDDISLWLSHQAAFVRADESGKMMLLRFPPSEPVNEEQSAPAPYGGDMVRGFPQEVLSSGLIFSRRFPDSRLLKHDQKHGATTGSDVQKLCTSAVFCEFELHGGAHRPALTNAILKQVQVLLIDEAGKRAGNELLKIAGAEDDGSRIAVGLGYLKSRAYQSLSYDAISPEPSVVKAFELGILPAVCEVTVPALDRKHYPSDSIEARTQIVKAHFTDLELYQALGLRQPYLGGTILAVPRAHTLGMVEALQKGYEDRKIPGVVVPVSPNTGSRELEKYMGRILSWMVAWKDAEMRGLSCPFARVLVSHAGAVVDGLDLPDVNVTIADPRSSHRDKLVRMAMRACRGHTPQKPNSSYRGLVRVHRFSDDFPSAKTSFGVTVQSALQPKFDHESAVQDGAIEQIPGIVVLPRALTSKEAKVAEQHGIHAEQIPFGAAGARSIKRGAGNPLPEALQKDDAEPAFPRGAIPQQVLFSKEPAIPDTLTSLTRRTLDDFVQQHARTRSNWESLDHACLFAERLMPEDWKSLWNRQGHIFRPELRSFSYSYLMNDPFLSKHLGLKLIEMLGIR